jgi:hypothetical protein
MFPKIPAPYPPSKSVETTDVAVCHRPARNRMLKTAVASLCGGGGKVC